MVGAEGDSRRDGASQAHVRNRRAKGERQLGVGVGIGGSVRWVAPPARQAHSLGAGKRP